jgi:CubicO group peptidase (beta-lactamase class C family)/predicted esterase
MYGLNDLHPQYGRAEYTEIIEKFSHSGFTVISEKRMVDTDVKMYARKVVVQIDSLLKKGVPANNISVIGTSKGGYIAQYISTYLGNPNVNFAFVGSYRDCDITEMPEIQFCGNILSIYEKTDTANGVSAIKRKEISAKKIPHFKEIELHTNLHHGFLYHPMDEWMEPVMQWANGNYNILNKKEIANEMDALLRSRPSQPFSGTILIKEGNDIIYSGQMGYADRLGKQPFSANSQFVIGSISKQFTAVLVLFELEKGHLKLSDTIGKYLPHLKQPWKDSITIYHLLTHTHGIVSRDKPLSFRPGSKTDYPNGNNIGYLLLSEIIEQTSKKPFSNLTKDLFSRYGMKNSCHPDIKSYHHLTKGYTQQQDGKIIFDSLSFQAAPAAGAMISTAYDLIKWNEALFGGRILKQETYRLLTSIQPHVIRQHPVWGATEYGLGITIRDKENIVQLGQTGFAPGFVSMNFYFPETNISVVALQNIAYDPGNKWQDRFYYHVKIIEMLRQKIKLGRERIEKNNFVRQNDTLPYRLIYPSNEDLTEKYPLVIYLHGSGNRGNDNERPLQKLPTPFLDSTVRKNYPCFVLVPQCPANDAWVSFTDFPNSLTASETKTQRLTIQLIRHLIETKDIDPNRVYLTGFSMGGEGTYDILANAPRLFACGVPVAGVPDTSKIDIVMHIPIWAFHGTDDKVNDIKYDRMIMESLRQKGGNFKLTELIGAPHNCINEVYSNMELWRWMFEQKTD